MAIFLYVLVEYVYGFLVQTGLYEVNKVKSLLNFCCKETSFTQYISNTFSGNNNSWKCFILLCSKLEL